MCRRHDDLKSMLDSSKDNLKLDAMKRIIGVCFDVLATLQQHSSRSSRGIVNMDIKAVDNKS